MVALSKRYFLICFLLIAFYHLHCQSLNSDDFKVGYLGIGKPMNLLLSQIGKPLRIDSSDIYKEYIYKNFTIWVDKYKKVSAFQITDSTLSLTRGLKVGDSLKNVIDLFGSHYETDALEDSVFERAGPYDYEFKDYSRFLFYVYDTGILNKDCNTDSNYGWCIIFYLKNEKVRRVLFYESICE